MSNAMKLDWAYDWSKKFFVNEIAEGPERYEKILKLAGLLRRAAKRKQPPMFRMRKSK